MEHQIKKRIHGLTIEAERVACPEYHERPDLYPTHYWRGEVRWGGTLSSEGDGCAHDVFYDWFEQAIEGLREYLDEQLLEALDEFIFPKETNDD